MFLRLLVMSLTYSWVSMTKLSASDCGVCLAMFTSWVTILPGSEGRRPIRARSLDGPEESFDSRDE